VFIIIINVQATVCTTYCECESQLIVHSFGVDVRSGLCIMLLEVSLARRGDRSFAIKRYCSCSVDRGGYRQFYPYFGRLRRMYSFVGEYLVAVRGIESINARIDNVTLRRSLTEDQALLLLPVSGTVHQRKEKERYSSRHLAKSQGNEINWMDS